MTYQKVNFILHVWNIAYKNLYDFVHSNNFNVSNQGITYVVGIIMVPHVDDT